MISLGHCVKRNKKKGYFPPPPTLKANVIFKHREELTNKHEIKKCLSFDGKVGLSLGFEYTQQYTEYTEYIESTCNQNLQ